MILFIMSAAAAQMDANSVVGRWRTETRHGVVEVVRCGNSICGTLKGSDGLKADPNLLDTKNKDEKLRGRRLLGIEMIRGFKWDGAAWGGGTIYNAEDGGTYKATATPVDADHIRLKGCIVWPLCKTQTWTRLP